MHGNTSSVGRVVLLSVLHQLFCPYALLVIIAAVTFTVLGAFHEHWTTASYVLTGTPYFPVQIAAGLIVGYCVGRFSNWPLTRWIWVFPAASLAIAMTVIPPAHGTHLLGYWFGWAGASGRIYPPLQPGFTMPLYLSAAYSFASLFGQHAQHKSE